METFGFKNKYTIAEETRYRRRNNIFDPVLNEGKPILTSVWVPTKEQLSEYYKIPFHASIKLTGRTFPYVVRNLLLMYSNEGDMVYDPFMGTGTTLYEGFLLKRKVSGSDLNESRVNLFKERWIKYVNDNVPITSISDATNFKTPNDEKVNLIIMSFPWFTNWKFTKNKKDSSMDNAKNLDEFMNQSLDIYNHCFSKLKPGGFICNILGNSYKNGVYFPITLRMEEVIRKAGFNLHYQYWNLRVPIENLIFPWNRSGLDTKIKKSSKGQVGWDIHEDIIVARKPE